MLQKPEGWSQCLGSQEVREQPKKTGTWGRKLGYRSYRVLRLTENMRTLW